MPMTTGQRVRKRRNALREAGLRPLQIWVPDARLPGFAEMCRAQSAAIAEADAADSGLQDFMDAALTDIESPAE